MIPAISKSTAEISHLDDQDQSDDQEEALSLRDLPITTAVDSHHRHNTSTNHSRRSSSSSSDPTSDFFFEFLVNDNHDVTTSPADEVIFRGHLLPYTPPLRPRRSLSLSSAATRSESLTESNQHPPTRPVIRPSRSLNCRKLLRNNSKADSLCRNSSTSSSSSRRRCNADYNPKSPWYWLVFGLPARIPAEMELSDIKNRQSKRTSLLSVESERFSVDRSNSSSASWRLLNVLSCKSHVSVDVLNTPTLRNNSLPNM